MSDAADIIEQQASRWLAARDAGDFGAEQEAAFDAWLQADIRHRVAYLKLEATWRRSDRLRDLRPLDRVVDPDLLRPARRLGPLAFAASVVLALVIAGGFFAHSRLGWRHYETRIGDFSRVVLEDGSIIDLNTDSELRLRLGKARREVRLLRGEGRFQVAHDAARPFVVSAAGADVRAVGTAFSVRVHDSRQLDVLVSEGTVAIDGSNLPDAPPVHAGEAARVSGERVSIQRVEPQLLARRLAWTTGRLQFSGETLADAVAEFNRYNRRHLELADSSLAQLRVGGTFNATDPESFAAALASTFNLQVDPGKPDAIILRPP
ncbi:MAG TPA: FecR domain-containing protein [Steroidobacteraceae bacterium]|nr:FecR domain-containing protein [Steroidobacteraceae bacterium]